MSKPTLLKLIKQVSDAVDASQSFTSSEKEYAKEIMQECIKESCENLIEKLIEKFEKIDLDIEPFLAKHNFYK